MFPRGFFLSEIENKEALIILGNGRLRYGGNEVGE